MKRVKIIATLGPASASTEVLRSMVLSGVNVFRLNMSHSELESHREKILQIRELSKALDCPLGILADLQGPKIRTGYLEAHQPVALVDQSIVTLTCSGSYGNASMITTNSYELIDSLEPGMPVLIDDGNIHLEVIEKIDPKTLSCRVVQGGLLNERKGINVPETHLMFDALTEKDRIDTLFALEMKVDYIALSFVQSGEDLRRLKTYINLLGYKAPPIIAKIEKPQALLDLEAILENCDGLMVARGDLGVELSPERVPVVQKQLIELANNNEKPVIVATQMLESMMRSLQPSRAEVSDVANAVFDGGDVLMLSGETAMGDHPVETIRMMTKIIEEAEKSFSTYQHRPHESSAIVSPNFYHAIAHSACYASIKADVRAIVVLSSSGKMARRISKLKPPRPIIALTPDPGVYQQLSLLWGVTPLLIPFGPNTDETLNQGEKAILDHQLLEPGDSIVFCAGNTPFVGATNMLKIYRIQEPT